MGTTRVVIMAGGTGGHVYPALAVAEELRENGCTVTWLGTLRGLEGRVVPAARIALDPITVAGIRGTSWYRRIAGPFTLIVACLQALQILRRRRPQVVLGMGGFVSGPGGLMARLLGVPLVIHEQNRIPGTTNRWLAKVADRVLEAFCGAFPPHVGAECTGNPLRRAVAQCRDNRQGRVRGPLRLLVLGGSQGAKVLNEIVPEALRRLHPSPEVRHQTGSAMRDETESRYREMGLSAVVEAFIEDMSEAYCWADVAVCRSGAMTVSELAAAGLPAVLVPYPHAIDDHQTANARVVVDAGGGISIPQSRLDPNLLATELGRFGTDPDRLRIMGEAIHTLARPDAAQRVAATCLEEARR